MNNPDSANPSVCETPFTLDVERRGDAAVVLLAGSCTMDVSARLGNCLKELASEGSKIIAVDMSRLDFIESTGLGGLVSGYLRARRKGGDVRLVAPPKAISDLLELTRLVQLFQVFPTIENALA